MIVKVTWSGAEYHVEITHEEGELIPRNAQHLFENPDRYLLPTLGSVSTALGLPTIKGVRVSGQMINNQYPTNPSEYFLAQGITSEQLIQAICEICAHKLQDILSRYHYTCRVIGLQYDGLNGGNIGAEPTLILGDRAFRLVPSAHPASQALETAVSQVQEQEQALKTFYQQGIQVQQMEMARRIAEIQEESRQANIMPRISLADIQAGVLAWIQNVDGERPTLAVSLPFLYRPMYLHRPIKDGDPAGSWHKIPEAIQKELSRDVRIIFSIRKEIQGAHLVLSSDITKDFVHYHYRCWGTWQRPTNILIPQGLYQVRDQLQAELTVINLGHQATHRPEGMLHVETLLEKSKKCETPVISLLEPPAPTRPTRDRRVLPLQRQEGVEVEMDPNQVPAERERLELGHIAELERMARERRLREVQEQRGWAV